MKKIICLIKGHIWVKAKKTDNELIYNFQCGRCNTHKEYIVTGEIRKINGRLFVSKKGQDEK